MWTWAARRALVCLVSPAIGLVCQYRAFPETSNRSAFAGRRRGARPMRDQHERTRKFNSGAFSGVAAGLPIHGVMDLGEMTDFPPNVMPDISRGAIRQDERGFVERHVTGVDVRTLRTAAAGV